MQEREISEGTLHSLLQRQLRRHGIGTDRAELRPLLEAVSAAYDASDEDRRMLERSMDMSSEELQDANAASRALKEAEEALRRGEARYRTLFTRNLAGVYRSTLDGRLLDCNETFARIYGRASAAEMLEVSTAELYGEPSERASFLERLRKEGSLLSCETPCRRKDGSVVWVLENVALVREGGEEYLEGTLIDITGRKALESQLLQAQKMEAVGRLAGGVAHDFNNFLTAIIGCSELMLGADALPPSQRGLAETIHRAAQKAASVTRQLLAFSRKQVMVPKVLDLSEVINGVEGLLARMIGEDVRIVSARGVRLWPIRADRSQLEQVLVNLAVNARDAMPEGGTLSLETANVDIGEDDARSVPGLKAGPYVLLTVTDTGTGMSEEVLAHLFEPFFTTKEPGKGTGLGLATVYGVVEQMGGAIAVTSSPGKGSRFRIFLPRWYGAPLASGTLTSLSSATPSGSETVLLVEDDELLRGVACRMLEAKGYDVLPARDPAEALEIFARDEGEIRLLITDVVMPQMNGLELARRLRKVAPRLKALFMSGYADSTASQRIQDENLPFLQKPFSVDSLLRSVRDVLDKA